MFAWSDGTPTVGFTMGEGWYAAQATVLSGAGYLAGAIALIGGLLVLLRQISWPRALTITAIGVVAIYVLNQLRLMLVLLTMGNTAQQGAHPLDDALGVVAMVIALAGVLTFFFFAVKATRTRARQA
jgi:exosortase/archaeosortase family protein